MIRLWECLGRRYRGDFAVFMVREDRSRSPRTGQVHSFYVVESQNWVNCLPITEDGQLVMIRQYRHGTQSVVLEVPGGLVDPGESPSAAAMREMREETGYGAPEVVHMGTMHPNPAIMNNTCHFYLARPACKVGEQSLDRAEDIEVVPVPLAEIPQLIRTGAITHGISLAGLLYLDLFLRTETLGAR